MSLSQSLSKLTLKWNPTLGNPMELQSIWRCREPILTIN